MDVFPFASELQEIYGRLLRALHDLIDSLILGKNLVMEVIYRVVRRGLADFARVPYLKPDSVAILHALWAMYDSCAKRITMEVLGTYSVMSRFTLCPSALRTSLIFTSSYSVVNQPPWT